MANQPTKYRKFVVGAASAALVASAVAPVASAAELSDIKGNTHEAAINALVDKGIVNGYEDGTFKPNKTLTRSDVVKMMGKWLVSEGYEVPADYKTNPRFTDLTASSNDELLKYAAVVKDNGVFNGSNGRLLAGDNMSRENMAVVIVRAFDTVNDINLVEYVANQDDFNREVTDRNSAKAEARTAIDVLDYFDITTVATFNPKDSTTRGHFASFLHRSLETDFSVVTGVVAGVESITAVNNTTVEVKFVDAVEDLADLNFAIEGLNITNKVIKQTDAKTVVLTTAVQEGGKVYTVTANGNKLGTFNGVSAVVPTGISVTTASLQGVIGQNVTLTAEVTVPEGQSKAGVPVTFNIVNNSATNEKIEAVAYTDDKGVASYTYTRYYASEDNVAAYATNKSSVVSSGKVYWASAVQLSVEELTTGNDLANETKKSYKVSGKPNTTYYIAIKENLGVTPDKITRVNVQNHGSQTFTTPYELTTGRDEYATVRTNSTGEASFTVYGSNLEATPIVYLPSSVNSTGDYSYSKLALQAQAPTVKFSQVDRLALAVVAEGTADSAEYAGNVAPVAANANSAGGRTYTVTVTDKDGKVAPAGSVAYVSFSFAGDVHFSTGGSNFSKLASGDAPRQIVVGKDGKAQFRVVGKGATSYVQPTIFLNTAGDVTPVKLDAADVQIKGEVTYFKSAVVNNAVLSVTDKFGRPVSSLNAGEDAVFTYQSVDQNGFAYRPASTTVTGPDQTTVVWKPITLPDGSIGYVQETVVLPGNQVVNQYNLAFDVTSTFGEAIVKDAQDRQLEADQNLGRTKTYQVKSDADGKAIVKITSKTADTVSVNVTGASNILPTKAASVSFVNSTLVPDTYSGDVVSYDSERGTLTFAGKESVRLFGSDIRYAKGTEVIASYDAFINLLKNATGTVSVTRTVKDGVTTFNIYNISTSGAAPFDEAVSDADQTAANAVTNQINALPATSDLVLEDEEDVEAARAAYDALTANQKRLVSTTKLVAAETKIADLKADDAAPTVTTASYTLNGEEVDLSDVEGAYSIAIPAQENNELSALQITLDEDQTVYVTGSTDIASINLNQVLKNEGLDKLESKDGVITLNLAGIAKRFSEVDFSSYEVGTQKTITLTLTDAAGNEKVVTFNIDVVAPEAAEEEEETEA